MEIAYLEDAQNKINKTLMEQMDEGDSLELNERFTLEKFEYQDEDEDHYVLKDIKYDDHTFSVQFNGDDIVLTDFFGYDYNEDWTSKDNEFMNRLEFTEDGDGVEYEIWKDTKTGILYNVPIEIVRDWGNIKTI
jgi:hypothetical protein